MANRAIKGRVYLLAVQTVRIDIAVAVDAEAHSQGRILGDLVHGLDGTVTGLAGDALGDVAAVVKAHEGRHGMDFDPWNGLRAACGVRIAVRVETGILIKLLDFTGIEGGSALDETMAIQAGGHRRKSGMGAAFRRKVAILTVDLKVAGVQTVRKGYRLFGGIPVVPARCLHKRSQEKAQAGYD